MARNERFALVTGYVSCVDFVHPSANRDSCGRGGIGEALVTEYTRRGIHAIATVLPHEARDHLSNAGITVFPLDVTVEQSVIDLKTAVYELTGGRLDILVNCA